MNLVSIKLSGFKSFADPTTITLGKAINAVVGPNGCGKSNILDAVRWVLGESHAHRLRGEVNSDLIFNGTDSRPPASRTRVELLFNNSDGEMGGEFAVYSEISIARELSLDSQSTYYLNGKACLRRDIQNVFYGTGFGANGYSIIQQGWINQILLSDPQTLRMHLEEAADVSKYRAQRHESLNKLNLTQQHLEQITFQRDTLLKETRQLKRQATLARQYQTLEVELRHLKFELTSNQLNQKLEEEESHKQKLADLEFQLGELSREEDVVQDKLQDLEKSRRSSQQERDAIAVSGFTAAASVNSLQEQITQLNTRIVDNPNSILSHLREVKNELVDLNSDTSLRTATVQELKDTEIRGEQIQREIERDRPQVSEAKDSREKAEDQIEQLRQSIATLKEQISSLETRKQFEAQNESRLADLVEAHPTTQVDQTGIVQRIQEETDSKNRVVEAKEEKEKQRTQISIELLNQQKLLAKHQNNQIEFADQLQDLNSRLVALNALQAGFHGVEIESRAEESWLSEQNLGEARRLAQVISVDHGWEKAIETVLGNLLQSIETDSLDKHLGHIESIGKVDLSLFQFASDGDSETQHANGLIPLASKLRTHKQELSPLLGGIYVAESIEDLWEQRKQLRGQESVICQDGTWCGKHWLRVNRSEQGNQGVLAREREIETLVVEQESVRESLRKTESDIEAVKKATERLQLDRETLQQDFLTISTDLTRHETVLNQLNAQFEEQQKVLSKVQTDYSNHIQSLETSRSFLASVDSDVEGLKSRQSQLEDDLSSAEEHGREASSYFDSLTSSLSSNVEELNRIGLQQDQLNKTLAAQMSAAERQELSVRESISELSRLILQYQEDQTNLPNLERKLEKENQSMAQVDSELERFDQQIEAAGKDFDVQREHQQVLSRKKEKLNEGRAEQIGLVNRLGAEINQFKTVLSELGVSSEEVTMSERDDETLVSEIERIQTRISRLGAINYRANEEFEEKSAELEQLNTNLEDLETAVDHLRQSIGQVDRDTKSSLHQTFDSVNDKFGQSFKLLFGGGRASIEFTETDILQAGVIVKAQPPGKRNSSIESLSGGEQALTALAFVFALFELNPSPVCILDEVDASLDEDNVSQFSDLLESMISTTQFIVITHNLATMERADTLLGITTEEAGVSRLVSVNLEDAYALAAN